MFSLFLQENSASKPSVTAGGMRSESTDRTREIDAKGKLCMLRPAQEYGTSLVGERLAGVIYPVDSVLGVEPSLLDRASAQSFRKPEGRVPRSS